MPKNRIRIIVDGDPRDQGHVRLTDFLRQLDSVRKALRHTEGLLETGEREQVYYRIIDAHRESPLTVTLEGVAEKPSKFPGQVVGKFLSSINEIKKSGKIPKDFDYPTAEAYLEITAPQRQHVSSLILANGRRRITIDHQYREKISKAIGPDEFVEGSVTGTLDTVRLHNRTAFEVFPTVGPKRVVCHFRPDMKEKVKHALESYVCVYGRLRYKHWDKFPHAIDASDLEVFPPDDQLPKLSDLKGAIPDLTGGLEAHEFLDTIRNG